MSCQTIETLHLFSDETLGAGFVLFFVQIAHFLSNWALSGRSYPMGMASFLTFHRFANAKSVVSRAAFFASVR